MKKYSARSHYSSFPVLALGFAAVALLSAVGALFVAYTPQKYTDVQSAVASEGNPITKRAMVVIYNPVMPDGRKLTDYAGWNSPQTLVQQTLSFFPQTTNNKISYVITETHELDNFPVKTDGFSYSSQAYADVLARTAQPHNPDGVNYYAILSDPTIDVCGKLNRNEIDELWLFGGPWFGYNESALATSPNGPKGFNYNGPVLNQSTCAKLLPIMGFNYERGLSEMIHNWGHRAEATMTHVYRGWEQNRTSHNWDRFGLVDEQSSAYSFSGCGSIHYPPNALSDYDYANTRQAQTACDDFYNYPQLSEMSSVLKSITCTEWGCNQEGFLAWWFKHVPRFAGTGPDGRLNDWWVYIMDPNEANITETVGEYSQMDGTLRPEQATFVFTYSGTTNNYIVDLSTVANMSTDVYVTFGQGAFSPVAVTSPQTKWDKYTCGRTLYWRVSTADRSVMSPIQTAVVDCSTPTPVPTVMPTPLPTVAPTAVPTVEPTPVPTLAPTLVPTASPAQLVYTFLPAADAYTSRQQASVNFGAESQLFTRQLSRNGDEQRAYLKFVVTKVPRFRSARLRLYVLDGSLDGPSVHKVSPAWNEATLRWNNQPGLGAEIADRRYLPANAWIEYTVSSMVRNNGTFAFALVGERNYSDGVIFSSREGQRPAELVISVQ